MVGVKSELKLENYLCELKLENYLHLRYIVGKSRHRAHTESQREESSESQFLGSLWRATHPVQRGMDANLGSLDQV